MRTIHYCKTKDCNNAIDYRTYKYGKGYCHRCFLKGIGHKDNCQCCICKTKRNEYLGKNNPNYKAGDTLRKYYCIDCNNKISMQTFLYRGKKCVSCSKLGNQRAKGHKHTQEVIEIIRQHSTGSNNPNWKGGISENEYPKEFNNELKDKIRKRDDYTCQNCSMTEEEQLIVLGYILSIHHIDYNKENCDEKNLITLCLWCNIRANYNRKMWEEHFKSIIKV